MKEENEKNKASTSAGVELIDNLEQPNPKQPTPVSDAPAEETPVSEPQPKKSKKSLVVFLICLAVVAVLALVWYLIAESPEGIFRTAVNNFNNAETVKLQAVSNFEFKNAEQREAESAKVTLSLSDTKLPLDATLDVKVVTPEKDEMSASLQLKIVSSKQIFIKTDNIENYLQDAGFAEVLKNTLGEEFYQALASNLDEGWWEIDSEALDVIANLFNVVTAKTSLGEAFTCLDNTQKITLSNATFLSVSSVENKDKTYKLLIDSNELAKSIEQPVNCFVEVRQSDLAETLASFIGELPSIYLEINNQKQFSRIYTSSENDIYTRDTEILFSYPTTNDFKMPESYGSGKTLLIRYGFNLLESAVN